MKKILVIPDLHIPFHHKRAFKFIEYLKKKYKPDLYVLLGDIIDAYSFSRFEIDPSSMSPNDELKRTQKELNKLYKLIPKAKVCMGNHDIRIIKRAASAGIPAQCMKSFRELFNVPKEWEIKPFFIIDNIRFEHGDYGNASVGKNATSLLPIRNMRSTVFGHFHINAGIHWESNPEKLLFGFNVGCLIDKNSYAFAYGKKWKSRPILGCGLIQNGLPYFIPMRLPKHLEEDL